MQQGFFLHLRPVVFEVVLVAEMVERMEKLRCREGSPDMGWETAILESASRRRRRRDFVLAAALFFKKELLSNGILTATPINHLKWKYDSIKINME